MSDEGKNLLVRAPNWIGDAVMATPVLHALRSIYPGARLDVLCRSSIAPIYDHNPHVDRVIRLDGRKGVREIGQSLSLIRRTPYDLGLLLPNSFGSALAMWLGGVKRRVGYARDGRSLLLTEAVYATSRNLKEHLVDYYLNLLAKMTDLRLASRRQILVAGEEEKRFIESFLNETGIRPGERMIGINPGAAFGTAKRWIPERFAQVAAHFAARNHTKVFISGSPDEAGLCDQIAAQAGSGVTSTAGRLSLAQFLAFMERLDLFITNDSGAMHIAAAMDRPIVAIFGSTDWVATAPHTDNAEIVRFPVECSPCMKRECPLPEHICMLGVSVEDVTEAAERRLAAAAERRGAQIQ